MDARTQHRFLNPTGIGDAFGADVTLNKSEVSWNTVPSEGGSGGGGIISMAATLTLNDSLIDHNVAPGGGGIASGNGMGGGPGSSITLNKSVISDNTAINGEESGGGGISNGGTLLSNNSQIINNHAVWGEVGAGLLNHVTATLNKTVVRPAMPVSTVSSTAICRGRASVVRRLRVGAAR